MLTNQGSGVVIFCILVTLDVSLYLAHHMHAPGVIQHIFSSCIMLGPGEVDWASLNSVCPSELLKFEETAAAALELAQLDEHPRRRSYHGDRSQSPVLSPRGIQHLGYHST